MYHVLKVNIRSDYVGIQSYWLVGSPITLPYLYVSVGCNLLDWFRRLYCSLVDTAL